MKTVSVDLKSLSATTLIRINQCNADKENLHKNARYNDKKVCDVSDFEAVIVRNTNISKVKNKIPVAEDLVTRESTLLLLNILNLRVTYLM